MVADFEIREDTIGSDGAPAQITNLTDGARTPNQQYRTDDTSTVDNLRPVAIPANGNPDNYSFGKSAYMFCTVAPSLQVDNVQFYTDGSNNLGTGIDVVLGDQLPIHNSGSTAGYIVATGVVGTSGNELTTYYTGISTVTSVFTFTQGSAKVITISETNNQIVSIGQTTDYLITQMSVSDATSPTITPNEVGTYQYDEI